MCCLQLALANLLKAAGLHPSMHTASRTKTSIHAHSQHPSMHTASKNKPRTPELRTSKGDVLFLSHLLVPSWRREGHELYQCQPHSWRTHQPLKSPTGTPGTASCDVRSVCVECRYADCREVVQKVVLLLHKPAIVVI